MPTNTRPSSPSDRWVALVEQFRADFPHLASWCMRPDEFGELRLKSRDDGTILAIAKGYGSEGGRIVSFGVGYDVILAFMALDSTIQGGHWRVDKPWKGGTK